jgi:hypothetical protein
MHIVWEHHPHISFCRVLTGCWACRQSATWCPMLEPRRASSSLVTARWHPLSSMQPTTLMAIL